MSLAGAVAVKVGSGDAVAVYVGSQLVWSAPSEFDPAVMGLDNGKVAQVEERLGIEPWATAYGRLQNAGLAREVPGTRGYIPFAMKTPYTPAPAPVLEDIIALGGFTPSNHEQTQLWPFVDDGIAAFTQALQWRLTDDDDYLDNAIDIMTAWTTTLTEVQSRTPAAPTNNGGIQSSKLQCAWALPHWVKCVELLRRGGYTGPVLEDVLVMLQDIVRPHLNWTGAGNTHMAMADARLQLAVARRDAAAVDEAVAYFNLRLPNAMGMASDTQTQRRPTDYYEPPLPIPGGTFMAGDGINTADKTAVWWGFTNNASTNWVDGILFENTRDISHAMMGVVSAVNACETAFAWGVDLYELHKDRIIACLELQAAWCREAVKVRADNSYSDATMDGLAWTPTGRYGPTGAANSLGTAWPFQIGNKWKWGGTAYQSGWELAYAHYVSRGESMPNTKAMLEGWTDGGTYPGVRAVPPRATNQTAYETLIYGYVAPAPLALHVDNGLERGARLSTVVDEPWAADTGAFWKQKATGMVDSTRTSGLSDSRWDVPVKFKTGQEENIDGGYYTSGIPFQVAKTSGGGMTVWNTLKTWPDPLTLQLHFPANFVRRETVGDHHTILVDTTRNRLVEIFVMAPTVLFKPDGADWQGEVTIWDLTKDWTLTPGGVIAAKVPFFPLLLRREEVESGEIKHLLPLVMDRYNVTKAPGAPNRGTDGLSSIHPVRGGERLRLSTAGYNRLAAAHAGQPEVLTILTGLKEYGVFVVDKSTGNDDDHPGQAHIAGSMDSWFADKTIEDMTLSDFEAVAWT